MHMNVRELIKSTTEHYLRSDDFNGLHLQEMSAAKIRRILKTHLQSNRPKVASTSF